MAVYTQIEESELVEFMKRFDYGKLLSYRGITAGVENTNYFVEMEKAKLILTIYEKRVNEVDLPFFLNLMTHLGDKGLACPLPVSDTNGEKLFKLSKRPAALISFLDGRSIMNPQPIHCAAVGRILAKIHLASTTFEMQRDNDLSIDGWKILLDKVLSFGDNFKEGLCDDLDKEMNFLFNHWHENLPSGVIHADLFPDNVFFKGDKISGIIDFYFACNDYYAYDLAICLNAWCFERDHTFNITKARMMINSYNALRKLKPEEITSLPILARGAALRFLLTRLYDFEHAPKDALVSTKDPNEYYMKLKFHRHIKSATGYGLDIDS